MPDEFEVLYVYKQAQTAGDVEQFYAFVFNGSQLEDPWKYSHGIEQILRDGWEPFQAEPNKMWFKRRKHAEN